jgi:hypothetical protein
MANGVRNSIWAAFFLAGMAFMATLIFMLRPGLFSNEPVRVVNSAPRIVAGGGTVVKETVVESAPASEVPEVEVQRVQSKPSRVSNGLASGVTNRVEMERTTMVTGAVERALAPALPVSAPSIHAAGVVRIVGKARSGRNVFGHATLTGDLPEPKTIEVFCGKLRKIPSRVYVRDDENSLADVLVVVTDGLRWNRWMTPAQPVTVVEKNCQFEPYVTAVQLGQPLSFENLDGQLLDFSIHDDKGRVTHHATLLPKTGPFLVPMREASEFLRIDSETHPWAVMYVSVIEHPFFSVTQRDGRFQIPNLPPGDYTITATHRKAGSLSQKVTVTERESPQLEFAFVAPTEVAEKK